MSQARQIVESRRFTQNRLDLLRDYPLPQVDRILRSLLNAIACNAEAYPPVKQTTVRVAKTNGVRMENGVVIPALRLFFGIPPRSNDRIVLVAVGTYDMSSDDDEWQRIAWELAGQA